MIFDAEDRPEPDQLKKAGVTDFQMDYAVKTIARLAAAAPPPQPLKTASRER